MVYRIFNLPVPTALSFDFPIAIASQYICRVGIFEQDIEFSPDHEITLDCFQTGWAAPSIKCYFNAGIRNIYEQNFRFELSTMLNGEASVLSSWRMLIAELHETVARMRFVRRDDPSIGCIVEIAYPRMSSLRLRFTMRDLPAVIPQKLYLDLQHTKYGRELRIAEYRDGNFFAMVTHYLDAQGIDFNIESPFTVWQLLPKGLQDPAPCTEYLTLSQTIYGQELRIAHLQPRFTRRIGMRSGRKATQKSSVRKTPRLSVLTLYYDALDVLTDDLFRTIDDRGCDGAWGKVWDRFRTAQREGSSTPEVPNLATDQLAGEVNQVGFSPCTYVPFSELFASEDRAAIHMGTPFCF